MNISQDTLDRLNAKYCVGYYDNNINEVPPQSDRCTEISILFEKCEDPILIHKSIKPKKGEITMDWIESKINAESSYKSFSEHFNKLVKEYGMGAYPTTYGVGVFVAVGFRESINSLKEQCHRILNNLGIEYTNEYSDAGWVFRYKISKSRENINKINDILSK